MEMHVVCNIMILKEKIFIYILVIAMEMVGEKEISAYAVIIDPTQNIQSTSTINITVKIVGVGVARNIVVNLSLNLSI